MKLFEISNKDSVTQNCIALMTENASILRFAQFYSFAGNSDTPRKKATASGGQFRSLNDDYEANKANPTYGLINLKIFGDKVELDKAYERRGKDIPSERARQLDNFMRNLGRNFQNEFFNGVTALNPKAWNGLVSLIPDSQKIYAAEEGLEIPLGISDAARTTQQILLEGLRKLISKIEGKPDVLYMNEDVLSRLTTIAAEYIIATKDDFGNIIPTFAGVPLLGAGYNTAGNNIIPCNETMGTFTTASTIYALKNGEEADLTMGTSNGLNVDDLGLVGNHYVHSVELDADMTLLNNKAVASLKGIVLK